MLHSAERLSDAEVARPAVWGWPHRPTRRAELWFAVPVMVLDGTAKLARQARVALRQAGIAWKRQVPQ
jgi:hypothetical protein